MFLGWSVDLIAPKMGKKNVDWSLGLSIYFLKWERKREMFNNFERKVLDLGNLRWFLGGVCNPNFR